MSDLLPAGIDRIDDCPYTLHGAILNALRILGYENPELNKDERPPRRIWMDGRRLEEHWAKVEKEREEKYGSADKDEDEGDYEENAVELLTRG